MFCLCIGVIFRNRKDHTNLGFILKLLEVLAETLAETKTAFTGDAEEVLELLNDLLAKRVLTEEGADGGNAHHQALLQVLRGFLNGQKKNTVSQMVG